MATHPEQEELEDDPDVAADGDQDEETDQRGEEPQTPAPPRARAGRPRSSGSKSSHTVTAVFKDEQEFQEFGDEADQRGESVSAYALYVLLNRGNTVEGAADWKQERRNLLNRNAALEGAKEQLQALFEQERVRTERGDSGLSGFDGNKAVTPKELQKLIAEGIAERDRNEKLTLLPKVLDELAAIKEAYAKLEEEYDELEDQMVAASEFEAKAKTYGPIVGQTLAGLVPPDLRARLAASPLGQLAGLGEVGQLSAGSEQPSDPLVQAALRTRDNISPVQGRQLQSVLDAIAKEPGLVAHFSGIVQRMEQQRSQAPPVA